MAVTSYQVVTANSFDQLATAVNALIGAGWQPLGGVEFSPMTGAPAQAMTQGS